MFSWLYEQKVIDIQIEKNNSIRKNQIASALLSSDQKRAILEKKILDIKTEGLKIALQETITLIREAISRGSRLPDDRSLIRGLSSRKSEIKEQLDRNSLRLAELSLSLSANTLALINSDRFNPIFILANKIANAPESQQANLIVSWAEQINGLNDVMDNDGKPILPDDRLIPTNYIRDVKDNPENVKLCRKLSIALGKVISFLLFTLKPIKTAVSAAFLIKFGMLPAVTAGICLNTPFSFMSGIISGMMYTTLCLGFSGAMIYRSESLKNVVQTIVDGKWNWNSKNNIYNVVTMSSIINGTVDILQDGHYAFLTDDLPIALSAALKVSASFQLVADFKNDPINTAANLSQVLHETKNISYVYIKAFANVQKNITSFVFDILAQAAQEEIKVFGHTVEKGAGAIIKTVAEGAITIGETGYNVGAIAAEEVSRVAEKAMGGLRNIATAISDVSKKLKIGSTIKNELTQSEQSAQSFVDEQIQSMDESVQSKQDDMVNVHIEKVEEKESAYLQYPSLSSMQSFFSDTYQKISDRFIQPKQSSLKLRHKSKTKKSTRKSIRKSRKS